MSHPARDLVRKVSHFRIAIIQWYYNIPLEITIPTVIVGFLEKKPNNIRRVYLVGFIPLGYGLPIKHKPTQVNTILIVLQVYQYNSVSEDTSISIGG